MRRLANWFLVFAVVVSAASMSSVYGASADKEIKALEGVWVARAIEVDGGKIEGFESGNVVQLFLDGNRYVSKVGPNAIEQGTITVDPGKSPAWIDLMPQTGEKRGQVVPGIYMLRGDNLVLCIAASPANRPIEFSAPKGDNRILVIYKRIKSR
jgi:uncharacterized protein (TIGR03067 family)